MLMFYTLTVIAHCSRATIEEWVYRLSHESGTDYKLELRIVLRVNRSVFLSSTRKYQGTLDEN